MHLLFAFCFLPFALFSSPVDSVQSLITKRMVPSTKNDTWFLNAEPDKHYVIDSSIFGIQYYNEAQRNGIEYANAGNTGTAAYPLVFSPNKSTGFNLGYNQYDLYRYTKDSAKYYQVIRPYTELMIMIGLKNV